ncbi:MAG: dihydrolipoyl dehydrogenase [Planctomycetota bacterium]|jgi:dihydrolipoamide dehydrogenase
MAEKFDIAVIGAGPGGARAARRCAQRKASVALLEKDFIGGTCLNYGCIPSKTLLASAHTLLSIKNAELIGVDVGQAAPNWPNIQTRKDGVVAGFRKGMTHSMQTSKVKLIQGSGTVTSPNHIKVQTDTETIEIQADKIILATGSEPIEIPIIPFDGQSVISSKEALELQQIPKSMVIVGGGVIGCEMACLYAAIGTKVTIVEALERLIPMEDQWVSRIITRELKKLGIDALTSQKIASVDKTNGLTTVVLETGQKIEAEKILVSVGRRATCDKETVENLKLKMNGTSIAVNDKMETNVPGVYAVGDVLATTFLAHGATAEAEVAAANATGNNKKIGDYLLIPRAVYTFPEIASVGKSEQTCKDEGLDISVGRAFFRADGRSVTQNQTVGEVRVLYDNATKKIIGTTIVGAMATELISLARTLMGTDENIADISFPHPTVTEALMEAVENALGLG